MHREPSSKLHMKRKTFLISHLTVLSEKKENCEAPENIIVVRSTRISVLNSSYKILSSILCERLKPYLKDVIGDYQCGFRPGKSTTDQIFTLRQILEKTREYQIDTHHLFIDFRQAYDSVKRDELYFAMNHLGIPTKLIKLCRMTLTETRRAVRVARNASNPFEVKKGFRQGDALSCDLFNICLEMIIRKAEIRTNHSSILSKSTQLLGYADDIDIISRTQEDLTSSFINIREAAEAMGLVVNVEKTKYMKPGANIPSNNIVIGGLEFESVQDFIYLGARSTQTTTSRRKSNEGL